ncbi:MAG: hypothetical protein Q9217_006469 [Psora testacea]
MGRKKVDVINLPKDLQPLLERIEEAARASTDTMLTQVLQLPSRRLILLRDPEVTAWTLEKMVPKQGTLAHTRGYIATEAYTECQANGALFTECVLLNGYMNGKCTNCFMIRNQRDRPMDCSLATENRVLEAKRKRKKDKSRGRDSNPASSAFSSFQNADIETRGSESLQSNTPLDSGVQLREQMPDTATDKITLLGALKLPNPKTYGLNEQRVCYIFSGLPEVNKLDERNYQVSTGAASNDLFIQAIPGDTELPLDYEGFVERELQAWFTSTDPRYPKGPPEMSSMVNASGSLKSVVAHHLNQPSFTTDGRSENKIVDESNPCIAMVMGNCFRKRESLILNHIHRRDARSEGVINYPKLVRAVHEDRARRIMALSAAKVEIVYGRVIQQRLLQTMKCTILPLWDRFNGIFLVLIHESNFDNADERYEYRRVILFAAHPHRMFYEQIGSLVAVRQDQTFEVTSLITDLKVEVDTKYYQLKKWYGKIPTPSQRAHTKARELLSLLDIEKTPKEQKNENKAIEEKVGLQHGEWDIFFNDISYSNRKTRALLSIALEILYLALDQSTKD